MKRIFIIILVVLVFMPELMAQDYKKEWTDGKLTWEDFVERKSEQTYSELEYFLGYDTKKQKYGDTIITRIIAQSYVDRKLSWINPEYKNEQYLRYNQVIFDIVETYRRRLQLELDKANSLFEVENRFRTIYSFCAAEISKFNEGSNSGHDLNSIIFWEQKTSEILARFPEKSMPEFENRSFGYALHAGLGAGSFTGSIGEHFSPTFNFMFGFDLAYKKSILYLNGTLAGSKVRKDYIADESWYKNQSVGVAIIDVSYGYALLDNRKLRLAPFVGLGITELSRGNKDNKDDTQSLVDCNAIFGLNADYKLRTRIKFAPNYLGKEKVETSIRARLYVTRADYAPDLNGYSINLTIGLCGFGNMIRVK